MSDWNVGGMVLIACNCDWGCPCNFNALPSRGFCQGGWSWMIDQGRVGDVKLDGLGMSLFAKWPAAIHQGGGQAVAFVDERADDAQRAAIGRLLRGELGGPWGIFANTYALAGPFPAAHRLTAAEHRTTLRIGDVVTLELEPIRNPVTGAEVHPEIVLPEGLVLKRASVAASRRFEVARDDVVYDHSGQYTAFGRFEYSGAAA